MDYISIAMLALGLVGIIFGFLFGRKRGFYKATVRLVMVAGAALIAFAVREQVTEAVLNTPVSEGKSILELLTEAIASGESAAQMEGFVNIITNVLKMVLQIFAFILTFLSIRIASILIYWIIARCITSAQRRHLRRDVRDNAEAVEQERKLNKRQAKRLEAIKADQAVLLEEGLDKKTNRKTKKHLKKVEKKFVKKQVKRDRKKWLGGLVGLVQGVLVVICVVGPLSGLVLNISSVVKSVANLEINGEKLLDAEATEMLDEIGITQYPDSKVAKVYEVAGGWLYRQLSTVENVDGTSSNIQSQIEAVEGGVKMVEAVSKLTELNFDNGLDANAKEDIVGIFDALDEIKNSMSEDSVQELDRLMKEALGPMLGELGDELPIDLNSISFAEVDFGTEGEVVESFFELYERVENDEEISEDELMEEVITTLSESTLILPVLSQVMDTLPEEDRPHLDEEEAAKVESILEGLENQENVDDIRKLLGLN